MDGIINVLKPPGMTSHDVVSFLRRTFKQKKIGHAGTLDPQAAGILPVCLGKATRLVDFLAISDKEYLCEMTLGLTTTTQDAWGEVLTREDKIAHITLQQLTETFQRFIGEIWQMPPMYSAIKIGGVPLYKKARQGQEVERPARQVTIHSLEILSYEAPRVKFLVTCSKGTYVRTLCHDLGQALGAGAHMSLLLRTRVGDFSLEESYSLEEIKEQQGATLLPLRRGLQNLEQVILPAGDIQRIRQGRMISLPSAQEEKAAIAVLDSAGDLWALGSVIRKAEEFFFKPKKVFPQE